MSSSRRTANEINILAMLDRREAGGLPQRFLRALRTVPTLFWYGAAGVVALGLVGSLAWLAHDSGKSASVDNALAGAVTTTGTPAPASASTAPGSAGATVVDLALAPEPASESATVAAAGTAVPLQTAAHAMHALPPPQHAGHIAPAREARRLAAQKPPLAPVHAEARGRRPATAPKPAPAVVDTDVALISAIIQHANQRKQAEEAAQKP